MSQQQSVNQLANLLGRVARLSVVVGLGGSALQAALYTGKCCSFLYCILYYIILSGLGLLKVQRSCAIIRSGEKAVMKFGVQSMAGSER